LSRMQTVGQGEEGGEQAEVECVKDLVLEQAIQFVGIARRLIDGAGDIEVEVDVHPLALVGRVVGEPPRLPAERRR